MKSRALLVLVGILLLLGIAILLAERAERTRYVTSGGKLAPGVDPDKAARIEIKTKEGVTHALEKKEGAWTVMPEGHPADAEAVRDALDKLAKLEKRDLAAKNPAKHESLEVTEATATQVKVWTDPALEPAAHLLVGKTGGDFASNFVRVAGSDEVYRSQELVRAALDRTQGFRDRSIVKFLPEDALRVELTSEAGRVVLDRPDEKASWTLVEPPPSGPADAGAVDSVVRTLSLLQADDFSTVTDPAATGLGESAARSLVKLRDGRTLEVLWGGDAGSSRLYVKRPDAETVWTVGNWRKGAIFPAPDTLRAPEPSPSPAGTPAAPAPEAPPAPEPSPAAPAATPSPAAPTP